MYSGRLDSFLILVTGWVTPTHLGYGLVVAQALGVAMLAGLGICRFAKISDSGHLSCIKILVSTLARRLWWVVQTDLDHRLGVRGGLGHGAYERDNHSYVPEAFC